MWPKGGHKNTSSRTRHSSQMKLKEVERVSQKHYPKTFPRRDCEAFAFLLVSCVEGICRFPDKARPEKIWRRRDYDGFETSIGCETSTDSFHPIRRERRYAST